MKYDLKIFSDTVDEKTLNQIYNLARQESFSSSKIRIMPDVHMGIGAVIGWTANITDKVIPNVVGVDIGCGMLTTRFKKTDIDFSKLDAFIRNKIPFGANYNKKEISGEDIINSLICYDKLVDLDRIYGSIGSLGSGNHFIEIDSCDDYYYLVVHSGSRNLGQQVASIYQKLAISICKDDKEKSKIPNDVCYLDGVDMDKYLHDMKLCQEFAKRNRAEITKRILNHLKISNFDSFETVHNYIDDNNIVRKGAVSSKLGERLLIPMNMRDGCIIAIGKGNDDWNCSAPHGAGRLYARGVCKENISLNEFTKSMQGVFTTSVGLGTLDESPQAYKPMQEILDKIGDTVEVEKIIKPIYNFKAGN